MTLCAALYLSQHLAHLAGLIAAQRGHGLPKRVIVMVTNNGQEWLQQAAFIMFDRDH